MDTNVKILTERESDSVGSSEWWNKTAGCAGFPKAGGGEDLRPSNPSFLLDDEVLYLDFNVHLKDEVPPMEIAVYKVSPSMWRGRV